MNLTLRQLLPQCIGIVYVVQPFYTGDTNQTVFVSNENMSDSFSDDELDREIESVIAVDDCLNIMMKELVADEL